MLLRVTRLVALVAAVDSLAACSGGTNERADFATISPDAARSPALDLGTPPDAGGDGPSDLADEPWFCVSDGGSATAQGDGSYLVETDHYALALQAATAEEATEDGHMAEAAWMAFASYYAATPTLGMGERLNVKWLDSEDDWMNALNADGVTPPGVAGGIYWTGTKTAYMYRQPTRYFTQTLFIHEMSHQFHFLSRTGNTGRPSWYIEGMAEYLSRHDWDGTCLRLGRMPMLTQEDYPAQALATVQQSGLDLSTIISSGAMQPRPIDLTITRYLERGDGGVHHAAYTQFRKLMDEGVADPLATFQNTVGDPMMLETRMVDTLADLQEPMSIVFLEWTHIKPGMVRGSSPFVSVARIKDATPVEFDATMVPSGGTFSGGVLATWNDAMNFAAYLVADDNQVTVFRYTNGKGVFWALKAIPAPVDGHYVWSVTPSMQGTNVTVNNVSFTEPAGVKTAGGVAVSNATVDFESIAWK